MERKEVNGRKGGDKKDNTIMYEVIKGEFHQIGA